MIVAFNTFSDNNNVYIVGGVFKCWNDKKIKYYICSKKPYIKGKGEVSYIIDCMKMVNVNDISNIIIDGLAWYSKDGENLSKDFGKILEDEINKIWKSCPTIICITREIPEKKIPHSVLINRGVNINDSLLITSSSYYFTNYDASLIRTMYGDDVIPKLLQDVKQKLKEII